MGTVCAPGLRQMRDVLDRSEFNGKPVRDLDALLLSLKGQALLAEVHFASGQ